MALAMPSKMVFLSLLLLIHIGEAHRITSSKSTRDGLPTDNSTSLSKMYNHINMKIKYHNLGEEILTFPERKPRTFNVGLATLKTWSADAIVQCAQSRRSASWSFDWQRSLAFAAFGFFYVGLLQWILYITFLTWLFPDAMIFANAPLAFKMKDRVGQAELLGQVLVDNFIIGVLIYFPIFYVVKELVQGENTMFSRVQIGINKYLKNIVQDNAASFMLWLPAGFFIFASPIWWRMPLEHAVSFAWTMIISTMRGASDKAPPKAEEARLSNDALCS